jgi:hypothetical protein
MINLKSFAAGLMIASACLLGPTAASAATASANGAAGAEAAARCISQSLPRTAQIWRASDGTFRVLSFGRRGKAARWTISPAADAVTIAQRGGAAGLTRTVIDNCD